MAAQGAHLPHPLLNQCMLKRPKPITANPASISESSISDHWPSDGTGVAVKAAVAVCNVAAAEHGTTTPDAQLAPVIDVVLDAFSSILDPVAAFALTVAFKAKVSVPPTGNPGTTMLIAPVPLAVGQVAPLLAVQVQLPSVRLGAVSVWIVTLDATTSPTLDATMA